MQGGNLAHHHSCLSNTSQRGGRIVSDSPAWPQCNLAMPRAVHRSAYCPWVIFPVKHLFLDLNTSGLLHDVDPAIDITLDGGEHVVATPAFGLRHAAADIQEFLLDHGIVQ
jgi:hypothetical protein